MRKRILLLLVCLGSLILSGCVTTPQISESEINRVIDEYKEQLRGGPLVKITEKGFDPWEVTVEPGQSVGFLNFDKKPHKIFCFFRFREEGETFAPYFYGYEHKTPMWRWYPFRCSEGWAGKTIEFWDELFPEKKLKVTIAGVPETAPIFIDIRKTGFKTESGWTEITLHVGQKICFSNYDNKPHVIFFSSVPWEGKGEEIPVSGGISHKFLEAFIGKTIEVWDELFPDERLKITIIE